MESLKIDSIEELMAQKRIACPSCKSSECWFCPKCLVPFVSLPTVELPIKVDIYRHPREKLSKSTAVYCHLVAPESINILDHDFKDGGLDYEDPSRVLILYPSETSVHLRDIDRQSFDRLVVIDGTWSQAKGMVHRLSTQPYRHVRIDSHETLFWRFQSLSRYFLSTNEAVYWFFVEYYQSYEQEEYDGRYDNLLYFFKAKYNIIQGYYRESNKQFTKRHAIADSYIQPTS